MAKSSNLRTLQTITLLLIMALFCSFASGKIIYVDYYAVGTNDGMSWENAYVYLQDALADANGSDKLVEIRVAQGVYTPDSNSTIPEGTGKREATFQLISGVTIAGGYAGAIDPNTRDIEFYETILSGDLNGDDVEYDPQSHNGSRYDNSYNVVTGSWTEETAVLDGFTITAGNANGDYIEIVSPGLPDYDYDNFVCGAGIYSTSGSPILLNCRFRSNIARRGGGVYNSNSNLTLTNCSFSKNSAFRGGGMYNYSSNPTLIECTFSGESAVYGGGMFNYSSNPALTNCTFIGNSEYYLGRGNGGGMCNNYNSNPSLDNCTFSGNSSGGDGGGIYNYMSNSTLSNCTFSGNEADLGGGMYNSNCDPILINCTFSGNSGDYGGGMYNSNCDPTLTNCKFNENMSGYWGQWAGGGGMYNDNSNTTLTNCTFSGNSGQDGGGMFNYSATTTLNNCTFIENLARLDGSGIYNNAGDGVYLLSNLTLTNCTFSGNIAEDDGGGMYNFTGDLGYGSVSNLTLANCTFSGNTARRDGGGICTYTFGRGYEYLSNLTMTDCTFSMNTAERDGGGMWCDDIPWDIDGRNPILTNCTFSGNAAQRFGGGMYNYDNNPILANCTFSGNTAKRDGGGMLNHYSSPTLSNCIFSGNVAEEYGGGMSNVYNCNIIGVNCTFAQNSAEYGDALSCDSYNQAHPVNIELINCILWDDGNEIWNNDNSAITITYSDIKDGFPGEGNIALDPLFANPGYWDPNQTPDDPNNDFWVDGDYHLKSRAGRWDPNSQSWVQDDVNSPCIDACDPMTPISHELLPHGGIINMGAYGGTIEASKSPYDINHFQQASYPDPNDGAVNVIADTMLKWVSDTNAVTHEVYFGASNLPPFIQKQYLTEFDPGVLEPNTQYYWRIDDVDNLLNRVTGNIWTFQTDSNDLIITNAYNPNPAYAAIDVELNTLLSWSPGLNAVVYDVYFGTDFNDVNNATTENPLDVLVSIGQDSNYFDPSPLEFDQIYYWRIDEINDQNIITTGNIWTFQTVPPPVQAYNPNPANDSTIVESNTQLRWTTGHNAVSHDVYFGTVFTDVNEASLSSYPIGVYRGRQDANTYYLEHLDLGTYYWRIDEVDNQGTIVTGDVWSFDTVPPPKGSRSCFTAETLVWIDGALIPMPQVKFNQRVNCIDGRGKIEEVQEHQGTYPCYNVVLDSGNCISVADNHCFMAESGQWLSLHSLRAGTKLRTAKGSVEIVKIIKRPKPYTGKVYNIKVAGSDQYMVGKDGVIVRDY